uniref:Uncharacterized protein n=1 Tax=Arion vulgaris TaxID=1028688 RepID=A0A0B7AEY6_9EUPU
MMVSLVVLLLLVWYILESICELLTIQTIATLMLRRKYIMFVIDQKHMIVTTNLHEKMKDTPLAAILYVPPVYTNRFMSSRTLHRHS